jgi:diguanylate cyclase (GGDEF)-like protein
MLQALAGILIENTRDGDILCRFGGEEFVVVLPAASLETALERIEACRQAFGAKLLRHQGKSLTTTLSAGVAAFPLHGDTTAELLNAADQAMYQAKQRGRNQVIPFF